MDKEFDSWNLKQKAIHISQTRPKFNERDIFWCSIGINIGHEENGKNTNFNRPVVVVKKFNSKLFIGVPLSLQLKTNPYYLEIEFHNRKQAVLLSHIRSLDSKRLGRRMGRLSENEFQKVITALRGLF